MQSNVDLFGWQGKRILCHSFELPLGLLTAHGHHQMQFAHLLSGFSRSFRCRAGGGRDRTETEKMFVNAELRGLHYGIIKLESRSFPYGFSYDWREAQSFLGGLICLNRPTISPAIQRLRILPSSADLGIWNKPRNSSERQSIARFPLSLSEYDHMLPIKCSLAQAPRDQRSLLPTRLSD